jgi:hypothetical protein
MPTPKKFDKPMTNNIGVRLTDEQMEMIREIETKTGMGTADIMRVALICYYQSVLEAKHES